MVATAFAVPLVLILAVLFARAGGSNRSAAPSTQATALPAITTAAPQVSDAATIGACTKVIEALPLQLGPLNPRPAFAERTVAWGNPAIVLRCGVARPGRLVPGSSDQVIAVKGDTGGTVEWLPVKNGDTTVFTTIDRPVYVEVSWPAKQDYNPLPELSKAISSALPAVCSSGAGVPDAQLCTHRS